MSIAKNVAFGLSWLLAAWAFGYWGVERLRISQTLRVLPWNSRIAWLTTHRVSAIVFVGLKAFQIVFVLWQAHMISSALPWTNIFLRVQTVIAIVVVLLGARKSIRKNLTINVGGEFHTGRWVMTWPVYRGYKGIILQDDHHDREGFISSESMTAMENDAGAPTVTVGVLPEMACGLAWGCNCLALLVCLVLFIVR